MRSVVLRHMLVLLFASLVAHVDVAPCVAAPPGFAEVEKAWKSKREFRSGILSRLKTLSKALGDEEFGRVCRLTASLLSDELDGNLQNAAQPEDYKESIRRVAQTVMNTVALENYPGVSVLFTGVTADLFKTYQGEDAEQWSDAVQVGAELFAEFGGEATPEELQAEADAAAVAEEQATAEAESTAESHAEEFGEIVGGPDKWGVRDFLQNRIEHYDIPRYDLYPYNSAVAFRQMFADLKDHIEGLQTPIDYPQLRKTYQDRLARVLGEVSGRKRDWEDFFKDVHYGRQRSLEKRIRAGEFDTASQEDWLKLMAVLEAGFEEIADDMKSLEDQPGSGSNFAGSGGGYGYGGGYAGGGASHAAVRHARIMARIQYRYDRRGYRIQRITGR